MDPELRERIPSDELSTIFAFLFFGFSFPSKSLIKRELCIHHSIRGGLDYCFTTQSTHDQVRPCIRLHSLTSSPLLLKFIQFSRQQDHRVIVDGVNLGPSFSAYIDCAAW